MARGSIKNLAIKEFIKNAAMKKLAQEEEQVSPFRVGGIRITDDSMFQASIKRVLGGIYKGTKFTSQIMPGAGEARNYQGIVFGAKTPQYYNDITQFNSKRFLYGLKEFDLGEPLEFDDDDSKRKLGLEGAPNTVPLQATCGWFKDDDGEGYKLLVIVPAPRTIFNRVVKVNNPGPPRGPAVDRKSPDTPDNPWFLMKTVVDRYTKYKYDYPIVFGQSLFIKTYLEYSFLYEDKFITGNINLTEGAGGGSFKRKIEGVSIKDIIESFQDPILNARTGQPDPMYADYRPALVSRNSRDAVDLNAPTDDPPTGQNNAWKTAILSRRADAATTPPSREQGEPNPLDELDVIDNGDDVPAPSAVPSGPGIAYADLQENKIYNRAEVEQTALTERNSMQSILDSNDSKRMNSWTSSEYKPPTVVWEAFNPRGNPASPPVAEIRATAHFPKPFDRSGQADSGSGGSAFFDMHFSGFDKVEGGFEAYIQTKDYVQTVAGGRITGVEGSIGREQEQFGEHKRAQNSLYQKNRELIATLNNKIDFLIETNIKYRNNISATIAESSRPKLNQEDGILKYMVDLEGFVKSLVLQTPKDLTELNNLLERPKAGVKKIRSSDVNLLRIIFDEQRDEQTSE